MSYLASYYTKLITSQYQNSPKFMSWCASLIAAQGDASAVADSMNVAFDIDYAVGPQLDTLGVLIGLPRGIKIPISGLFFSWDNVSSPPGQLGWNDGSWRDPSEASTQMSILPDDAYRQLLKYKILTNAWDGTLPGLYETFDAIFASDGLILSIQDNQNMSMVFTVTGHVIHATTQYILQGNYLPVKPAGVSITYVFVTT
jgi:hypothetical protein